MKKRDNKIVIQDDVQLAGHYKLEVVRPDGTIRKIVEFDNLITDQGLNHIASPPTNNTSFGWPYINTHVEVGTGNATPAFTDTACQSPLAMYPDSAGSNVEGATMSYVAATGSTGYWQAVWFYQFATGAAAGNLTEICTGGCLSSDSHVRAFSRALILDGGGSPTTLTVLSDEVLRVTYTLRMYFIVTDSTFSFVISGTTYSGTKRRANLGSGATPQIFLALANFNGNVSLTFLTGTIAGVTSNPGGSSGGGGAGGTRAAYIADSHYVDFTFAYDLSLANGTMNSMLSQNNHGDWQFSLSPALVKNNTQTMTIVFRYSWGRYTP